MTTSPPCCIAIINAVAPDGQAVYSFQGAPLFRRRVFVRKIAPPELATGFRAHTGSTASGY